MALRIAAILGGSSLLSSAQVDLVSVVEAVARGIVTVVAWTGEHGILAGAAAAAAAWIAWQAHQRELSRIEEREDAADARIAGLAFVVRRTLAKSLQDPWLEGDGEVRRDKARNVRSSFMEHESRVAEMLAEAASASSEVAADVRKASRMFWHAADGVGDAADCSLAAAERSRLGTVTEREMPDEAEAGLRQARCDVENCVEILRRLDAPIRESDG